MWESFLRHLVEVDFAICFDFGLIVEIVLYN